MNVSELARKLKVDINRLREMLPEMGFDVGGKAVQVDNRTAQKIIDNWRDLFRKWKWEKDKREEYIKAQAITAAGSGEKKDARVSKFITVRELASKFNTPVNNLMKLLMKSGVLASLNDNIDFETASIIGDDLGWKVLPEEEILDINTGSGETVKDARDASANLAVRPPVVVVMGHVDHGKTKILDTIRSANVMGGEAGGITQHIGAYEAEWPPPGAIKFQAGETSNGTLWQAQGDFSPKKRKITFIDTPGHEAFTAMRSRGAKIADIAILVVAADDGVQPQTREVVDIIAAAKMPFVVAINKMDKSDADPEKVKRELADLNFIPEDWGGKTICVPVSAKTGDGIDKLLETILLVADMEAQNIQADKNGETVASVIESHIDKGEGVAATLLVQNGTLRVNDYLKVGNVLFGRVRAMKNWKGEDLKSAMPSQPVKVLGLKVAPEVGDVLVAVSGTKGLEKNVKKTESKRPAILAYDKKQEDLKDKIMLNIILKTDVLGSAEAIIGSLEQFAHPRVGVKVLNYGLGNITEADIDRASASSAAVYGFNVQMSPQIEEAAREKSMTIEIYQIIYELLDSVEEKLQGLLKEEVVRADLGKIKVLALFRQAKDAQIIGGQITQGKVMNNAKFDIIRANVKIGEGAIARLQSAKQNVSEAVAPSECGLQVTGKQKIEEGDILLVYSESKKEEKIKL